MHPLDSLGGVRGFRVLPCLLAGLFFEHEGAEGSGIEVGAGWSMRIRSRNRRLRQGTGGTPVAPTWMKWQVLGASGWNGAGDSAGSFIGWPGHYDYHLGGHRSGTDE